MAPTGADRLLEALERHGVPAAFGLPGTQVVELWEALRRHQTLRTVVATNELAAAFMANGAARATGTAAALLTIPGPGFAYSLAGIAEARLDSAPLLLVAPEPARRADGGAAQQAIDQAAIAAPLAKAVIRADTADDLGRATTEALELAEAGEPGPVYLEVGSGAFGGSAPSGLPPGAPSPSLGDYAEVANRLDGARRPILLVGQGAQGAAGLVRELAERLGAPVLTTTSGRGVVAEDHPLCVPFDTPGAPVGRINELVESADLILALGCKLSYNGSLGTRRRLPSERLVRVDTSLDVLAVGYPCAIALVTDCRSLLEQLRGVGTRSEWKASEIDAARIEAAALVASFPEPSLAGRPAADVFSALRRAIPPSTPIVTDSGHHQYLARQHHVVLEPRTFLVPSDFQSMGFGIAGAIGAAVATRAAAAAIVGDGGLNIGATELLTAVSEQLDLLVVVLVDHSFGLIRLQQLARTGRESGVSIPVPDIAGLSAAVGARYERLADGANAEAVFASAVDAGGVTVVEVPVGDPPKLAGMRLRGRAISTATSVLGPAAIERLKAARRRSN
jgi:thiamine pyrophosphate-dependent acetolactate synthase large subunit-like protein